MQDPITKCELGLSQHLEYEAKYGRSQPGSPPDTPHHEARLGLKWIGMLGGTLAIVALFIRMLW